MSIIKGGRRSNRPRTRRLPSILVTVAVLGSLLCLERASASESRHEKRPTLRPPVTDSKPMIDGKIDEPCWKEAAKTGPFEVARAKPSNSSTEAFILRDAEHLYVGVRCARKEAAAGRAKAGESSKETEFVELSIDSNDDGNSYYLIRITPDGGGTVASSYHEHTPPWGDRTWQPQFESAAARGAGAWAAELALPLDIFRKNKILASRIGFHLRRSGMPGGETHCWGGAPGSPREWGLLTGIPARDDLPPPDYSTRGLSRFYQPPNKARTAFLAGEQSQPIPLGPGSAHPGTTGEVGAVITTAGR